MESYYTVNLAISNPGNTSKLYTTAIEQNAPDEHFFTFREKYLKNVLYCSMFTAHVQRSESLVSCAIHIQM